MKPRPRRGRVRVLLAVAVLALAGCGAPAEGSGPAFDGDAAYDFVAGLVGEDAPRYRVPGTTGHAEGAAWLWAAMDVPGWQQAWDNFTGEDYLAHPAGGAAGYQGAPYCGGDDEAELPGLRFHNLLAFHDVPGTDRHLLLAAHWDSKEDAEDTAGRPLGVPVLGANDGASGVGLLLQLMRHIADGDLRAPVDITIAFFDGEDGFEDCHPLAGSIHHARTMAAAYDRMILLDMVGDADARFARESRSKAADPALQDLIWEHGQALSPQTFTDIVKTVVDDHVPFIEEGVAAVDIIDYARSDGRFGFPPYWHTDGDTIEKIDAGMLAVVGNVLWLTLEDERFVATWPS